MEEDDTELTGKLSNEMWLEILTYLTTKEVAACRMLCLHLKSIAEDALLWKHQKRRFAPDMPDTVEGSTFSWLVKNFQEPVTLYVPMEGIFGPFDPSRNNLGNNWSEHDFPYDKVLLFKPETPSPDELPFFARMSHKGIL